MKLSVKNELLKLVDSFQNSADKLKYRNYSVIIDTSARGNYVVIVHYPQVLHDIDLFALVDFARANRLSCFLGGKSDIFMQ